MVLVTDFLTFDGSKITKKANFVFIVLKQLN